MKLQEVAPRARRVECSGILLTHCLADSHTHAVFDRWRADEYVLRCRGLPFMEIARRGGVINASVLAMTAACSQMRITPAEAIRAATIEGATALELGDGTGTIAPGVPADFVLWRVPSIGELPYRMASQTVEGV